MAWVEGMTVLVLFLLYLPAKKLLDFINLDGGTGLIGWTHGVFVILYVLAFDVYVSKTQVVLGTIHRWGTVFVSTIWHLHL